MSVLLLLVSYEQKISSLVMFDALKTVMTTAL